MKMTTRIERSAVPSVMTAALTVASMFWWPSLFAQELAPGGTKVITSPRPLLSAAQMLEGTYFKPVTYEEAIRVWREDLQPIPGRDENSSKALFPKTRSFVLPPGWNAGATAALDAVLLGKILDAYHAQNDGARFRVRTSSYALHIVPSQINDAQGRLVAVAPLLDTIITVPIENRVPSGHLDALAKALARTSGTVVWAASGDTTFNRDFAHGGAVCQEGDMFPTLLPQHPDPKECQFEWGSAAVPAREALISLLEQSSTTMTWHLLCGASAEPQDRSCTLDVGPPIVNAPRPDGSVQESYLLYDRCARCPPPGRHLAPLPGQ